MPVERGHVLVADGGVGGLATAAGLRHLTQRVTVFQATSGGGVATGAPASAFSPTP
jgi:hypothetical protein